MGRKRKRKARVEGELSFAPEFFSELAVQVLRSVAGARFRSFDHGGGLIARLVKGMRHGGVHVRSTGEPVIYDIEVSADPARNLHDLGLEIQKKLRGLVRRMTDRSAVVNIKISGVS